MGRLPTLILRAMLKPKGPSQETLAAMLANSKLDDEGQIIIGQTHYFAQVMGHVKDIPDEAWQVNADEGDIVVFSRVIEGPNANMSFRELHRKNAKLEKWVYSQINYYKGFLSIDLIAEHY